MLVSVIMGVYNAKKKDIQRCLSYILGQTYRDFELIICDDGSTDNTYPLLLEYAKKDNRIRLIRNETNMGLAFALNKCIAVSKGELLIRHDIDDYSDITRFEKQIAFMNPNPQIAFAGSNIHLYDEQSVWGMMRYPEMPTKQDFLFCFPFMHGAMIMRKEAVLAVGGYRVSKATRRTEDFDLFSRMYVYGYQGYNLQEALYFYKEDENAQSKRKFRYRIDECKVKFAAFSKLGLMPKGIFYAIKPVVVGLIPKGLLAHLKDKYYKRRDIS